MSALPTRCLRLLLTIRYFTFLLDFCRSTSDFSPFVYIFVDLNQVFYLSFRLLLIKISYLTPLVGISLEVGENCAKIGSKISIDKVGYGYNDQVKLWIWFLIQSHFVKLSLQLQISIQESSIVLRSPQTPNKSFMKLFGYIQGANEVTQMNIQYSFPKLTFWYVYPCSSSKI